MGIDQGSAQQLIILDISMLRFGYSIYFIFLLLYLFFIFIFIFLILDSSGYLLLEKIGF